MTLSKVKCFLLDMDGTFYLGGRILAQRAILSKAAGRHGAFRSA